MRLRAGVGMVCVVAVTVLAACGSSSKSPSATPTTLGVSVVLTTTTVASAPTSTAGNFDSCSVVTQEQAAGAIGATVTAGVLGTATVEGGLACVFYGAAAPSPHTPDVAQPDSVRVVVVKGPDAVTWYDDYETKVRPQAVAGYGDQAYFDGSASLSVLKGTEVNDSAYLRIAVSPAGAPPSLSDEERLATAILPLL
jgi:hypothetical protein